MKKETRSRRVTIAVTPSFWARFGRYTKTVNKTSTGRVSRTDLIMHATERLMREAADGQCVAIPSEETGNAKR